MIIKIIDSRKEDWYKGLYHRNTEAEDYDDLHYKLARNGGHQEIKHPWLIKKEHCIKLYRAKVVKIEKGKWWRHYLGQVLLFWYEPITKRFVLASDYGLDKIRHIHCHFLELIDEVEDV